MTAEVVQRYRALKHRWAPFDVVLQPITSAPATSFVQQQRGLFSAADLRNDKYTDLWNSPFNTSRCRFFFSRQQRTKKPLLERVPTSQSKANSDCLDWFRTIWNTFLRKYYRIGCTEWFLIRLFTRKLKQSDNIHLNLVRAFYQLHIYPPNLDLLLLPIKATKKRNAWKIIETFDIQKKFSFFLNCNFPMWQRKCQRWLFFFLWGTFFYRDSSRHTRCARVIFLGHNRFHPRNRIRDPTC